MIDGMEPYPSYKTTNLPWLEEIPKTWDVCRNGRLFAQRNETGFSDLPILEVSLKTGVRVRDFESSKRKQIMSDREKYKRARSGDIAYNMMRMWQGAVGVSPVDGLVSPAYVVARPFAETNARYFALLFRTGVYMHLVNQTSRGIVSDRNRLYWEDFKQLPSPCPPPDQQTVIVRFIDYADQLIHRYNRAKKKLLTLLNEQKQAIIHQAVTCGLDPIAKLKPSGVGWLGDVPEQWSVTTVRRLITFITSGSRGWAQYFSDSGDLFIQSGNLGRSMALKLDAVQCIRPPKGAEGTRTVIWKDDVLICVTGALTGNVVHVDSNLSTAYVNQHVSLLRPNPEGIHPRFLAYVLHSELGRSQFKFTEYGGTKQGLGLDDVRNVVIPLPPLAEQERIIKNLDAQCVRFQNARTAIEQELAFAQEFRTRLIADVITGKLDVREAAARLPDESEELEAIDSTEDFADLEDEIEDEDLEDAVAGAEA